MVAGLDERVARDAGFAGDSFEIDALGDLRLSFHATLLKGFLGGVALLPELLLETLVEEATGSAEPDLLRDGVAPGADLLAGVEYPDIIGAPTKYFVVPRGRSLGDISLIGELPTGLPSFEERGLSVALATRDATVSLAELKSLKSRSRTLSLGEGRPTSLGKEVLHGLTSPS